MLSLSEPQRVVSTLRPLRGRRVLDFFPALCRIHPDITEFRFATYRRAPGLGKRLLAALTPEDDALRGEAERCGESGVAFSDAFLSGAMKRGTIPEKLVDLALRHDFDHQERRFVLSRNQVLDGGIQELLAQLPGGEGLLACSRLELASGKTAYLPMLDFTCPVLGGNGRAIRIMVKRAGLPEGILVGSGRSYHFYGVELLSAERWIRFMALALLFAPITDSRYIAHRLADGECRLKIMDSADHFVPVIQEVFYDDGT
jgi:hypothetical protein